MDAGGSGMSRSATISHPPLHRTSKTASPGRGQGLTVRIEHDMMANISQSMQSAPPARTIRRLPVPPVPLSASIVPKPSTAPPKYFSAASLNSNNSLTPKRTPRPLPCPPVSKDHSCFIPPESSHPMPRPPKRIVRPLPTPVQRVDHSPLDLNNILKPLGEKNNFSEEKVIHNGLTAPREDDSSKSRVIHIDDGYNSGERIYDKENHRDGDIPLLQKRIDLLASPSDDGAFIANSFPNNDVPPDMSIKLSNHPAATKEHSSLTKGQTHTHLNLDLEEDVEEEDPHVDYAWVLSNRTLYHQKAQQHTSKWVREQKGKRYTEQDYENILKVLRTL